MVLHNAHVVDRLQRARGWHDVTLEADHWAALGDISPIDAAMLLCRFNPNESSYDDARLTTTDELKPEQLVRLAQRLADIDKAEHKPRTLQDWHQAARGMGLTYHSWIDGYMEATTPPAPPVADTATPAPVVAALVELDKAGPVPVTTRAMADSFAGLHWNAEEWIKKLGDKPVWVDNCIAVRRGRGEGMRQWNPVQIGAYLVRMEHANANSVRARFQTQPALIPWLDEWKTYEADNHSTD